MSKIQSGISILTACLRVSSSVKSLRFYPSCKLTGEPATVLWMLAEGMTLWSQIILLISAIPGARISAFSVCLFPELQHTNSRLCCRRGAMILGNVNPL